MLMALFWAATTVARSAVAMVAKKRMVSKRVVVEEKVVLSERI